MYFSKKLLFFFLISIASLHLIHAVTAKKVGTKPRGSGPGAGYAANCTSPTGSVQVANTSTPITNEDDAKNNCPKACNFPYQGWNGEWAPYPIQPNNPAGFCCCSGA